MTERPKATPAGSSAPTEARASQTRADQIAAEVRRQSLLVADADSADVGMLGALDAALEGIEEWSA